MKQPKTAGLILVKIVFPRFRQNKSTFKRSVKKEVFSACAAPSSPN